jgi:hypothetical protein
MIAGDTIGKVVYLQTLSGRALSYANKTAFQADGWDISWVDTSAVALTSQPTWTVADLSGGRHLITYTVPSGVGIAKPTVPGAYADPGTWAVEGQSYDEDLLAGLMLTAQGTPTVQSATDGDLGDVVMGDSWSSGTLTVPLGKISPFGYTTLTGFTISAGFKRDPSDTVVNSGITATIISNSGLTCSVSWDTFPTGMNLSSGASDLSALWYLDVQLKNSGAGRILTPLRYSLRVVWQRDTTT